MEEKRVRVLHGYVLLNHVRVVSGTWSSFLLFSHCQQSMSGNSDMVVLLLLQRAFVVFTCYSRIIVNCVFLHVLLRGCLCTHVNTCPMCRGYDCQSRRPNVCLYPGGERNTCDYV